MKNSVHDFPHEPAAWLNGAYCAAPQAALPVTDLGLHGIAVTEMLRTYDQDLFRLLPHLRRLDASARLIGLEIDAPGIEPLVRDLVRHNFSFTNSELGVVIFVTAGGNPTYLGDGTEPTVGIHTFELRLKRWAKTIQDGVHIVIPKVRALPEDSVPSTAKIRSRIHWYLAAREARDKDAQALLVNADGFVTETPSANFFAVFGESVVTPATNVLPGISREVVRDLCPALGLRYEERNIRPDDIQNADELFLASTPYGLMPVTKFENTEVGDGLPGPVFFELCNAWSELVGIDILEQITSSG